MTHNGLLVVISSPSGGGKSTVIHRILSEGDPRYRYSISVTTRAKRPGETNGVDYWFVTESDFTAMIGRHELVEHERVHGHLYGTPAGPIEQWLKEGRIIFFDIDVKGAFAVQKRFPAQTLMIFLAPPDLKVLEQRLIGRGTESSPELKTRLARVAMEMEMGKQFEFTVVNRDLEQTIAEVKQIIASRLKPARPTSR